MTGLAYATGVYAKAICDRCGFKVAYLDLGTEPLTKLRVCDACMDEYPPELIRGLNVRVDGIALRHPRPDQEDVTVLVEEAAVPAVDTTDNLLLEDGDELDAEDGDDILIEGS